MDKIHSLVLNISTGADDIHTWIPMILPHIFTGTAYPRGYGGQFMRVKIKLAVLSLSPWVLAFTNLARIRN